MTMTARRVVRRGIAGMATVVGAVALLVAAPAVASSAECEPPGGLLGLSVDDCGIQASLLGIDISIGGSSGDTTEPVPEPEPEPAPNPAPEPEPQPAPSPKPTTDSNTGTSSGGEQAAPSTPSTRSGTAADPRPNDDRTVAGQESTSSTSAADSGSAAGNADVVRAPGDARRVADATADGAEANADRESDDGTETQNLAAVDGGPPGQVSGPVAALRAAQQVGPAAEIPVSAEARRGFGPMASIVVAAVAAVLFVAAAVAMRSAAAYRRL